MQFESIPLTLAVNAHRGTSFIPEERGKSEVADYDRTLRGDWDRLYGQADTEEKRAILAEQWERYARGYRARYMAQLSASSRCLSPMITGPSSFPTHRNEKRNNTAHRRLTEVLEYRKRALAAITKAIHPEWRPVMAGDSNACERLQDKIGKAEKLQATMKAANTAIRANKKKGEAVQVAALVALGLPDSIARELLKPDFCGRIGFAGYALTNNNANIKRMKQRLANVERNQATPATERESAGGIRLEDSPSENRVRLYFPGKPAEDVRQKLKSCGFRWAPSLGCWQAYRNWRSLQTANELAA